MISSLKYFSPSDPESVVLVSTEKNWTNIKVYANGGLQYEAENGEDLRTGRKVAIDGFGTLNLHLKSELEVSLNGFPFEKSQETAEVKVANVSAIFWVLTVFTGIGLLIILLVGSQLLFRELLYFLVGLQVFALLVYAATAILLKRGVYWFYFVGASVFTFFTATTLIDIEQQISSFGSLAALIVRLILLVLMLRIIPTILQQLRKSKGDDDNSILDQ